MSITQIEKVIYTAKRTPLKDLRNAALDVLQCPHQQAV